MGTVRFPSVLAVKVGAKVNIGLSFSQTYQKILYLGYFMTSYRLIQAKSLKADLHQAY